MDTKLCDVIRGWLGWCPNARTFGTVPRAPEAAPVVISPQGPDSSAPRPGRMDRGVNIALGSIAILLRNLKLLVFSFLSGLVMLFSLASAVSIQYLAGTSLFPGTPFIAAPATVLVPKGSLLWTALTFGTSLAATFLSSILLAALILCVSSMLTAKPLSISGAIRNASSYAVPILGWAVIGAAIGTVLSFFAGDPSAGIPLLISLNIAVVLFFILMMFVIPAIVLDGRTLGHAIATSLSVFRRAWAEIVIMGLVFFVIIFAITLTSLIPMLAIAFSSGNPAAAGGVIVVYMLVMLILLFLGTTVVGIATLGVYRYAEPGERPLAYEKDGRVVTFP